MGMRNRYRRREKKQRRKERHAGGTNRRFDARAGSPDAVGILILAAAEAFHHEDPDYEAMVQLLVEGPPAPGGRSLVDQLLAARLQDALSTLWGAGWQPADVARVVVRKLGAAHRRVVGGALRAESLRYPPGRVSAAWKAQLDALHNGDGQRLPGFGEQPWVLDGATTRPEAVAVAVEVLSLLWHLPALPRLCDPPGSAGAAAAAAAGAPGDGDDRVLARVRALLAQAESTDFSDEAEAFTAKAQELMSRHAIDRAVVEGRSSGAKPSGRRLGVDDPYADAKALLLAEVAEANRCRAVWSKDLGFSTVLGFPADLEATEVLYTSLLVQAATALSAAGRALGPRGRRPGYRRSFLVGFGWRIGTRLREASASAEAGAEAEHGPSLLPVLARREEEVDRARDEAFPGTTSFSPAARDQAGWLAGRAAAEVAKLWTDEELDAG